MARLFRTLSCFGLVGLLGAAGAASASPLTTATWLSQIAVLEARPGLTAEGAAIVTVRDGPNWNGCVCVSLTLPAFQSRQIEPFGIVPLAYQLTLGGSQRIHGTRDDLRVDQGVAGAYRLRFAAHAPKGVNLSMLTPVTTLVYVPLSIGASRTAMGSFYVLGFQHFFTAYQYGWVANDVTLTGLTFAGAPLPDAKAGASFRPPVDGQPGQMTLVAPARIHIDGPLLLRRTASFTYLSLDFDVQDHSTGPICVPEPGSGALLAAGLAGSALAVRRRRRAKAPGYCRTWSDSPGL